MNSSRLMYKRKKRRKKRVLKSILLIVCTLFFVVVGYGGYLAYSINNTAKDSYKDINKSKLRMNDVKLGKDPVTILVVGVENYSGGKGRSDVIQLYSINPETKEKVAVSIPRDTRAYIKKVGYKDKIAHSYSFGGIQGTIHAVENMLDIPIDYYVTSNFKGFEDTVDAVGGINVKVPFDFKYYDTNGRWVTFEKGDAQLNGKEALAFVRMRKDDPEGDFGRNKREQLAIRALADEALSVSSVTKIDEILVSLGDNVTTNIKVREIIALRNFYKDLLNKDFETLRLEGENTRIDGVYYYEPYDDSIDEVSAKLKNVLELDQEKENGNASDKESNNNDSSSEDSNNNDSSSGDSNNNDSSSEESNNTDSSNEEPNTEE